MKLKYAAVVTAALAMMLPATSPTSAKGKGGHAFHFSNRLHLSRQNLPNAFGAWPLYGGGVVAVPPYAPVSMNYVEVPRIVYVPLPPQALTCHRSRETVTVPSEAGGTRAITVTRC